MGSWSQPIGGSSIPFQRLATNDDPDLLRGYPDLRFRDRGLVVITGEYRWPIWASVRAAGAGVDAYLLADAGQVFRDRRNLLLPRFTTSYGGGLRIITGSGFAGRVELAWSDEGMQARLGSDQVFQFSRGGLYHGRNPIPLR
jgi:hemolysin activation/secretion protein